MAGFRTSKKLIEEMVKDVLRKYQRIITQADDDQIIRQKIRITVRNIDVYLTPSSF